MSAGVLILAEARQGELREVSLELVSAAREVATRAGEVDLDGAARTEHVSFREVAVGDVDITKAEFLLSIGRGIEDKDNIPRFERLADKFGATLSVSRPIVDSGWVSNARQV